MGSAVRTLTLLQSGLYRATSSLKILVVNRDDWLSEEQDIEQGIDFRVCREVEVFVISRQGEGVDPVFHRVREY